MEMRGGGAGSPRRRHRRRASAAPRPARAAPPKRVGSAAGGRRAGGEARGAGRPCRGRGSGPAGCSSGGARPEACGERRSAPAMRAPQAGESGRTAASAGGLDDQEANGSPQIPSNFAGHLPFLPLPTNTIDHMIDGVKRWPSQESSETIFFMRMSSPTSYCLWYAYSSSIEASLPDLSIRAILHPLDGLTSIIRTIHTFTHIRMPPVTFSRA
jgi:hypothetical protein